MQVVKQYIRLLAESKFYAETRAISRAVMSWLARLNDPLPLESALLKLDDGFKFKVLVALNGSDISKPSVTGQAGSGAKGFILEIEIPMNWTKDELRKNLSIIRDKIEDVIRHEIEHLNSPGMGDDVDNSIKDYLPYEVDEKTEKKVVNALKLFATPEEIRAYAVGFVRKAKKQRVHVSKIIDEEIVDLIDAFEPYHTQWGKKTTDLFNHLLKTFIKDKWTNEIKRRHKNISFP